MVLVQSESYPGLRWFDLEEEIDEYTETRGMAPHNGEATFVLGSLCLLDGDPVICTRQPRVSRGESNRRSRPGLSISGENLCLFLLVVIVLISLFVFSLSFELILFEFASVSGIRVKLFVFVFMFVSFSYHTRYFNG
ncbi:hypothetical protein TB2_043020 [Malus domestica]